MSEEPKQNEARPLNAAISDVREPERGPQAARNSAKPQDGQNSPETQPGETQPQESFVQRLKRLSQCGRIGNGLVKNSNPGLTTIIGTGVPARYSNDVPAPAEKPETTPEPLPIHEIPGEAFSQRLKRLSIEGSPDGQKFVKGNAADLGPMTIIGTGIPVRYSDAAPYDEQQGGGERRPTEINDEQNSPEAPNLQRQPGEGFWEHLMRLSKTPVPPGGSRYVKLSNLGPMSVIPLPRLTPEQERCLEAEIEDDDPETAEENFRIEMERRRRRSLGLPLGPATEEHFAEKSPEPAGGTMLPPALPEDKSDPWKKPPLVGVRLQNEETRKMNQPVIDSGKLHRQQFLDKQPLGVENDVWRRIEPRDAERIECDRYHFCAEHAVWASRRGRTLAYVCDYHRAVFDVTGTFWKGEPAAEGN